MKQESLGSFVPELDGALAKHLSKVVLNHDGGISEGLKDIVQLLRCGGPAAVFGRVHILPGERLSLTLTCHPRVFFGHKEHSRVCKSQPHTDTDTNRQTDTHLGDLCGFPASRLPDDDDRLVALHQVQYVVSVLETHCRENTLLCMYCVEEGTNNTDLCYV